MNEPLKKLNVGCGNKIIPGWVNIDANGNPDIVADVLDIPLPDNCASELMAIHVFEHLERWDAPRALLEWKRLLAPGGMLILELPDLLKCCYAVCAGAPKNQGFNGLYGDPTEKNPHMMHRWGWTVDEVRETVREAGFLKVKSTTPQFHGKRIHRDMRIEALKPKELPCSESISATTSENTQLSQQLG